MPTLGPPTTSTLISLSKDFLRRMPLIGDEFILVNYPPPTNKKILNHFGLGKKNSNKRGACQTGEDRLTTGRAPAVKKNTHGCERREQDRRRRRGGYKNSKNGPPWTEPEKIRKKRNENSWLRKEISKWGGGNIFSLKGFFGVKNADEQERGKVVGITAGWRLIHCLYTRNIEAQQQQQPSQDQITSSARSRVHIDDIL